jgi:hypothetical protein
VTVDVTLGVEAAEESARVCCGEDPELAGLVPPCDPNVFGSCQTAAPATYCPVVSYREGQRVMGEVVFDHAHPAATQVLVRFTETPAKDEISDDAFRSHASVMSHDFELTEDEYCFSVEVWNLIEDSIETIRKCTINPKPTLGEVAATSIYFSSFRACLLPPEGYVEQWCAAGEGSCENSVAYHSGETYQYWVALCAHYYELCDAEPPPEASTLPNAGGGSGGSGGSYASGGVSGSGGTKYELESGPPSLTDGCEYGGAWGAVPASGARGLLAGSVVLLLSWLRRRVRLA